MEFLPACLGSLRDQDVELEAVVVDNGSGDGSAELVRERYPEVEVLELGTNLGFGPALNRGVAAHPEADPVILLNDDAAPEPDFVAALPSTRVGVDADLDVDATEVRTIARGSIPASLEGEGLRAALDDLRVATDVGIDVHGLDDSRRPYVIDATLYRVVADCAQTASDRVSVTLDGTNGEMHMRVAAPDARVSDLTVDRIEGLGGSVRVTDDDSIATFDVAIPLEGR